MYKIAVLVPSFKPGYYINRCFESLEHQTLPKDQFKVYIALNGSPEKYKTSVLSYLSNYSFNYEFTDLPNAGVSNARNYLLDISKENFIVFIDDDDLVSYNYLENLLSVTDSHYMGVSNIKNFEITPELLKRNYIGDSFNKLRSQETSKFKSRKYYSSPVAKMLHRDMISSVRFNTSLSIGEDSLFMAQISSNIIGVRKASKDTCYLVYEREGSSSRRKVSSIEEIKRITYLTYKYSELLISSRHDKIFISTRIAATLKHLKKVFI